MLCLLKVAMRRGFRRRWTQCSAVAEIFQRLGWTSSCRTVGSGTRSMTSTLYPRLGRSSDGETMGRSEMPSPGRCRGSLGHAVARRGGGGRGERHDLGKLAHLRH
jgi:hypothetical protein